MTVEASNYPDNYYSDLTGDEEYYEDIMVAVEFGVIDLDAGLPFRPEEAATREFAAHTLNFALGFHLEDTEYTFNEAAEVTYPEDKVIVRATAADGSGAFDDMEIMVRPIAQGVQVYSEAGGRTLFSFRTTNWWVRSNTTLNWDLSTQVDTIAMAARVYPYYGEDSTRNAMQAVT